MNKKFRVCAFGGFDKKDVTDFIEKQSKSFEAELDKLRREKALLKETVQRLEAERESLLPKAQQQENTAAYAQELEKQNAALREKEKSGYGSTRVASQANGGKAFHTGSVDKLRDMIDMQRALCVEEREHSQSINRKILKMLQQAELMLEDNRDIVFERTLENLQQIEKIL